MGISGFTKHSCNGSEETEVYVMNHAIQNICML